MSASIPQAMDKVEPGAVDEQVEIPFRMQGTLLLSEIAQLFNSSKLSDATIFLGAVPVPAHQFVICLQSPYFDKALNSEFAESQKRTLTCEPGREHAYARILKYLYTGQYEGNRSALLDTDDDPELLKHPRVYFLADEFLLKQLKDEALRRFERTLDNVPFDEDLCNCIKEVFANTSSPQDISSPQDGMRVAIVNTIAERSQEIPQSSSLRALIRAGGDFAEHLAVEQAHRAMQRSQHTSLFAAPPAFGFGQPQRR